MARGIAEVVSRFSPEELGETMGDELLASIPEFADALGEDLRTGLVASCTANLQEIQRQLAGGAPSYDVVAPEGAIAWAREVVHRGLPLSSLLRAYRLGHGAFERSFDELAGELDLDSDLRWRMIVSASRYVFVYIDAVCLQLTQDYEAEREQWLRGAEAARLATIRAILDGEVVDADVATQTLRYDVVQRHLALVVWSDPSTGESGRAPVLTRVALGLAGELGGGPTTTMAISDRCVWAWTAAEQVVSPLPARSSALPPGISAAAGSPQAGLAGMARSHHEARQARRAGEILGHRPGVLTRFQAVSLVSLTSADPAQTVRFVRSELGELSEPSDLMVRLRATLRVYLEEHGSPARTGRRLSIHQNTVVYRVRQAEKVLGRPVSERRLELEVALRLCDGLDGLTAAAAAEARVEAAR